MRWSVLILRDGAARLLRMRPSRRAHARSSSQKLSRVRAPQDEDDHRLRHSSPCQTAHLVPAARFCARALPLCFAHPHRGVGGAPRDVRVRARHPLKRAMTRHARRLRGALRPMTRDARLSALHRGDFGPRCRFLFRHLRRISELPQPDAWRGGPGPPGASGYKPPPQDATPRSAFRMSPETPLKERGCNRCSLAAISSQ
jgi:hypothetical protein